jgi:hypothetical protein
MVHISNLEMMVILHMFKDVFKDNMVFISEFGLVSLQMHLPHNILNTQYIRECSRSFV